MPEVFLIFAWMKGEPKGGVNDFKEAVVGLDAAKKALLVYMGMGSINYGCLVRHTTLKTVWEARYDWNNEVIEQREYPF